MQTLPSLVSKAILGVSLMAFSAVASAGEKTSVNILADGGRVKPVIKVSEAYKEKVVKFREPGEGVFREVTSIMPLSITVVGNLEGATIGPINDDTPVELSLGGMEFFATLGESREAERNNGVFPINKTKATFELGFEDVDANDNPIFRKVGSVVFKWPKGKLSVKLEASDTSDLEIGEVGATDFIGLYVDDSEEGTSPSGSVNFQADQMDLFVMLGGAEGSRITLLSGVSSTKLKVFGRGDNREEFLLEKVEMTGVAGPVLSVNPAATAAP